jgi:hypothetical protein
VPKTKVFAVFQQTQKITGIIAAGDNQYFFNSGIDQYLDFIFSYPIYPNIDGFFLHANIMNVKKV